MKKGWFSWVAVVVLGTTPLAAEPISAEIALARRLFAEARAAEETKDWTLASSKLREAMAIKETGGLRFHLAYCEEQQGMLVEALVDYERADDLTAGTNDDLRAQLPAKREALHRRIPTVTLLAPPKPSNPSIAINGHSMPVAVFGKPIPLNPGKHTLVVSAPEHTSFTTQVSLNERDSVVANVILSPLAKPAAAPALPPAPTPPAPVIAPSTIAETPPSNSIHPRTYVLIGEAAVALGAAGVGIGYALRAASDEEDRLTRSARVPNIPDVKEGSECQVQPNSTVCKELQEATDDGRRHRLIARVAFIGAGITAASFVGTLLLWRAPSKVAIIPMIAPGAADISVSLRF